MMMNRFILLTLFATFCMARIHNGDEWISKDKHNHRDTRSILSGIPCLVDNKVCDPDTTCAGCCSAVTYTKNGTTLCGYGTCLDDGIKCSNETYYQCDRCCNGAYNDGGTTCGGTCISAGVSCNIDTTCNLCCNGTYYQTDTDGYKCGCLKDGTNCIPNENCYSCCNGAYTNNGFTCGGKCITDGEKCTTGKDCHLCCTYSSYWYSTGQIHCGPEPCYKDGTICIPKMSCTNCCSDSHFNNDGTVCGGTCAKAGTKCTYYGNCTKCCTEYPERSSPQKIDSTDVAVSMTGDEDQSRPRPRPMPLSYWDSVKKSMVCGIEKCLQDGTSCIPGYSCYNCCNGSFANGGTKCGGTCLANGKKCNIFSTCSNCCMSYKYDKTLATYVCVE
jgi:hypothetical protein